MNRSEMEQIKGSLETDLAELENDIYRLQAMLSIGKAAIRADRCEEFGQLLDIMSQIDGHLQSVIYLPEVKEDE